MTRHLAPVPDAPAFPSTSIHTRLDGWTTDVRGRFVFAGEGFHLVSDASVATGGPGQAISSYELLAVAVLTCITNVFRGAGDVDSEVVPSRRVRLEAHVDRAPDSEGLGSLRVRAYISDVDDEIASRLVAEYKSVCKIYQALKDSWEISITAAPMA